MTDPIQIANEILSEVKILEKNADRVMDPRHEKFLKMYPAVSESIMDGTYNESAFRRYLKKLGKSIPENEANYAKFLYMEKNPRAPSNLTREVFKEAKARYMKPKEIVDPEVVDPSAIAQEMYATYVKLKDTPDFNLKNYEQKQEVFRLKGFGEFMKKFMTVSRYIIEFGEFKLAAFRRYTTRLKKLGYAGQEGWAEREADYVKLMWMEYNPHADRKAAQEVWRITKDRLADELKNFKKDFETAKEKVTAAQKEADAKQIEDLKFLMENDPIVYAKLRALEAKSNGKPDDKGT